MEGREGAQKMSGEHKSMQVKIVCLSPDFDDILPIKMI